MKTNVVKLFIVALCLFCVTNVTAQDSLSVVLEKAGSLGRVIKKKHIPTLQKLKIKGEINSEDINFLTTLPQIKVLDISEIEIQPNDEKAKKSKGIYVKTYKIKYESQYGSSLYDADIDILHIPSISTLETMIIPKNLIFSVENMHLKNLVINKEHSLFYYDRNKRKHFDNMFFDKSKIAFDFCDSLKKDFSVDTIYTNGFVPENMSVWRCEDGVIAKFEDITKSNIKANFCVNSTSGIELVLWDDNFDISIISKVNKVSPYAYFYSKIDSIKLADDIITIGKNSFNNWKSVEYVDLKNVTEICDNVFFNCENLKTIKADNVKFIGDSAFYQNHSLTSITLKNVEDIASKAFYGTSIEKLILPATIKRISKDAFEGSNIKQIEFLGNTPPEIYEYSHSYSDEKTSCLSFHDLPQSFWNINYIIPNGTGLNYDKGLWYEIKMVEKDSSKPTEYELIVCEPGEIKKYLTDDILTYAESLIVRGVLYHEDLEALDLCKNLRKLDLSKTFITLSPNARRYKAAETAELISTLALAFGGMADYADDLQMNSVAETIELYNSVYDNVAKAQLSSNPDCSIPELGSNYFKYLEEVIYPMQLDKIEKIGDNVKKVVMPNTATKIASLSCSQTEIDLPDSLKDVSIEAFSSCEKLQNIIFPTSLEYCNGWAFRGCNSLKKIDFSQTSITRFECDINDYYYRDGTSESLKNLEEIYFPESIIRVGGINNIFGEKPVKVHFKSRNTPDGLSYSNFREGDVVYIPKGCRSGWIEFISKTKATVVEY